MEKPKKNIHKKSLALQRNLLRRKGKLQAGCYQLGQETEDLFDETKP
ncbi:hypothetical protein NOVO_00640 [Rickettsiales bacterium Ac37b]|nr:hypothetical protein NOVO_00640 [Rickettsiales bacterium Ac37b]